MGGQSSSYSFDQPGSASNIYATVLKNQFANYLGNFVPTENKSIAFATDPTATTRAATSAMATTGQAFDTQQQSLNKNIRTSGITLTPTQQASLTRQTGIAKTVAMDDAANRAGIATYNNQTAALSGSQGPASLPTSSVTV